jgi:hypothetical protein
MVSGLLLGLGVAALVRLYAHSADGIRESRHQAVATQLALQRLESLAGLGVELAPDCPASAGCLRDITELAAEQPPVAGYDCTMMVRESGFTEGQQSEAEGLFRVDVALLDHPDLNQMAGSRFLRVSVCWTEDGRKFEQVQLERLMVPEV